MTRLRPRQLPTHLVFCGGGTRCLVFLETLVELEQRDRLKNVKEYWGTSAGGLLASLLALTKSATAVKRLMLGIDYSAFRDMDVMNLVSITTTWGLDDGTALIRELERLFERIEPGCKDKRLADVPGLHIVVADLNAHETVVCNSVTQPGLRVVDALRASMSLPLIFRPFVHPETGHYWVDGAVRAHFPWHVLPNDEARNSALGFAFEKSWMGGPRSLTEYLFSMIHFDEPKKIMSQKEKWPRNILWYPTPPYPAWFVKLQEEDFRLVEDEGRRAAEKYLTEDDSPHLPETRESPPVSAAPNIPLPTTLPHCTTESSGTPTPFLAPGLGSSPPQSLYRPPVSRRWSL